MARTRRTTSSSSTDPTSSRYDPYGQTPQPKTKSRLQRASDSVPNVIDPVLRAANNVRRDSFNGPFVVSPLDPWAIPANLNYNTGKRVYNWLTDTPTPAQVAPRITLDQAQGQAIARMAPAAGQSGGAIPDSTPNLTKKFMDNLDPAIKAQGPLAILDAAKKYLDGMKVIGQDPAALEKAMSGNASQNTSNSGSGSAYYRPAFDTSPYDQAIARIGLQSDAGRNAIDQYNNQLIQAFTQGRQDYGSQTDALRQRLAAMQNQAQQSNTDAANMLASDLSGQGGNVNALRAQAAVQAQAQQEAASRQQDYLSRLAQLQQQASADRTQNANQLFAGLKGQLSVGQNQAVASVNNAMVKAMNDYANAGRGGGGRSSASAASSEPTDAQLNSEANARLALANKYDPTYELSKQFVDFGGTLPGADQAPAYQALSDAYSALQRGDLQGYENVRAAIANQATNFGRGSVGAYNRTVAAQGVQSLRNAYEADRRRLSALGR